MECVIVEDMRGEGEVFLRLVGLQLLLEARIVDKDGACYNEAINACVSVCVGGRASGCTEDEREMSRQTKR